MEFNEKLQQLRKQKNLTQEELAELLYVSRTAISKWELGRGYPSIESLKAIAKYFSVSIDELLSGDELISLAETDKKKHSGNMMDLVFGILDCMVVGFLFFPFFGQKGDGMIQSVSLLSLTGVTDYMWYSYMCVVIITALFGVAELALQNIEHRVWIKNKLKISLILSFIGTMLFVISQQPYTAFFLLCILVLKGILVIKQR